MHLCIGKDSFRLKVEHKIIIIQQNLDEANFSAPKFAASPKFVKISERIKPFDTFFLSFSLIITNFDSKCVDVRDKTRNRKCIF